MNVPDPRGGRCRSRGRGRFVAALYPWNARRSPSPYRRKTPDGDKSGDKSGRRHSPNPGAAKGGRNDGLCFYHSHFGNKAHKCEKGCSYQEN